jgi:hypothetical protein
MSGRFAISEQDEKQKAGIEFRAVMGDPLLLENVDASDRAVMQSKLAFAQEANTALRLAISQASPDAMEMLYEHGFNQPTLALITLSGATKAIATLDDPETGDAARAKSVKDIQNAMRAANALKAMLATSVNTPDDVSQDANKARAQGIRRATVARGSAHIEMVAQMLADVCAQHDIATGPLQGGLGM